MLKKQLLLISCAYSIVLTALCLVNVNGKLPDIENSDKVYHVIAYFVFMILWSFTFYFQFKFIANKALVIAFITSVSFGIILEVLQGVLTKSRQSDVNDVIANIIGALLALFLLLLLKKKRR